ncbi:hypothetical protein LQM11_005065 [Vibrio parahaemolyticus]|uniref:type IV toxin-antitoxin system AbiEi family antitoxin n=1 Tax=Vibrio alginolyticus TaxID=663 RepID=UPI001BD3AE05|nr:hypothetical protein [Vibrio alginolyticus]EIO4564390.1 hypothetical protein [Vibrio parahaemolyticus]MBS9975802.1 hypothetical protein [Vibrio alginolyticus]MBT0021901.1 hypothetical protein [Vibrio alginolyticus]
MSIEVKIEAALERLHKFDRRGIHVYRKSDLRRLFFDDSLTAFQQSLPRLVKAGVLERVCNGVYVFSYSRHKDGYTIEYIAKCLRRGEYNYISLESALSEYSVISQVMLDRITIMTTGRKGEFKTPYGVIEFTHTKRDDIDIISNTITSDRPLRIASKETAIRDLKRVGRNTHLLVMNHD